mgnify:CR=1 FL=1
MSKTLKQKVRHILYDKDGNLNLRVPFKLRWSYINKIRRHNLDRDLDRTELAGKRDKSSKADMKRQIENI